MPVRFSGPIPYRRISKHHPALKASSCFIHLPDQRLGYGKNREKTHGKSPSIFNRFPWFLATSKSRHLRLAIFTIFIRLQAWFFGQQKSSEDDSKLM